MAKKIPIKGSTTDSEIASSMTSEEILARFLQAKDNANVWDPERDRLRKFIQEHVAPGRHGRFILELNEGTPRLTASSEGNRALQSCCVVDTGLLPKLPKAGLQVHIVDAKTGEVYTTGIVLANSTLYNRKPPVNVNITEIPDES